MKSRGRFLSFSLLGGLVVSAGIMLMSADALPSQALPGQQNGIIAVGHDSRIHETWNRTHKFYGPMEAGYGNGAATDDDGNLYAVGQTSINGVGGYWEFVLLKYDGHGRNLWYKKLDKNNRGTSYGLGVAVRGNFIYTIGYAKPESRWLFWVIKWDAKGNQIWEKTIGHASGGHSYGAGIDVDDDGNIFVTQRWLGVGSTGL
jgi:hypothetical protein